MDTPTIVTPTTNLFAKAYKDFQENKERKPQNYPLILIEGDSGTGKTASMRNLPPLETAIINPENKPLSFLGAEKYPYHFTQFNLPSDVDIAIDTCFKEKVKYVVMDSFTKYSEMLTAHATAIKATDKNNYAKFNVYNECIATFLHKIKNCGPRHVIIFGIPELVGELNPDGTTTKSRRLSTWGKQWEGKIEKEFTLVLMTKVIRAGNKSEYKFITNNDGTHPAKTPQGMFKEELIDNDLLAVCKRVEEFYKLV